MTASTGPPRFLVRLLASLLPADASSRSIIGDLGEDYVRLRTLRGPFVAGTWYFQEVVRMGIGYGARRLARACLAAGPVTWRLARLSTRRLAHDRLFTATAILVTALGVATSSTSLGLSRMLSTGVLGVPDAERVVLLSLDREGQPLPVGYADWQDWRDHLTSFDRIGISAGTSANLERGERTIRITTQVGTSDYLTTLGATMAFGRMLTAEDDRGPGDVAVLGHGAWVEHFGGDPAVVGHVVRLDGVPVSIVGVLAAAVPFGGPPPDAHLPVSAWPRSDPAGPDALLNRVSRQFVGVARLAPGVSLPDAQAEMARVSQALAVEFPASNRGVTATVEPLRAAVTDGLQTPAVVMQVASILLFLVGTLNVISLLLVRLSGRSQERAVELALGANRHVVLAGPVVEAGLLGVAGALAGALGHWWLVSAVNASALVEIPAIFTFGPDVISLTAIGLCLTTALVITAWAGTFSVAPRGQLSSWLAGTRGSVGTRRTVLVRRSLVAAEVAATTCLVIVALVLGRSFSELRDAPTGYQTENRIAVLAELPGATYDVPDSMRAFRTSALDRLHTLPGVSSAAIWSRRLPGQSTSFTTIVRRDRPVASQGEALIGRHHFVTAGAMEGMGLQLLRGRWMSEEAARAGLREVVISEALENALWPEGNALGQTMRRFIPAGTPPDLSESWSEVVGVVSDARFSGRVAAAGTLGATPFDVYYSWEHTPQRQVVFLLSCEPCGVTMSDVRQAIGATDPDVAVFDFQPLSEMLASEEEVPRLQATIMGSYSAVVLGVSAIGLFGLLLSSVRERSRELCLRSLLGCSRRGIIRLVLAEGLAVSIAGAVVGLALALPLTSLVSSLLFGITPHDPLSFAMGPLLVLLTAVLSSYLPARTGSRQDLTRLLR